MARILDFADGFVSSVAPTPISVDASDINFDPYGTVASTNVQDAIEELIDEKIQEVASTDNAVVRFNGTTGDIQNSGVIIDDQDGITLPAKVIFGKQDVASAASIVALTSSKSFIRITGATASSILGVSAGVDGQILTIHNASSAISTFMHEDAGASASDRMKFTDGENIDVDPDSSIELIYDGAQSRWVIKSGAGTSKLVGYQEQPVGVVNGINTNYTVLQEPITVDSLLVYVDGVLVPGSHWSILATTVTLDFAPAIGQSVYVFYLSKGTPTITPPPSGVYNVEYRTITLGEETADQLTLAATPSAPLKVLVDVIGGTVAEYGVDFSVSTNILQWATMGLDGLLTAGEKLRIVYYS